LVQDPEVDPTVTDRPNVLRAGLLLVLIALAAVPALGGLPSAHAAPAYGPLTVTITGPTYVGETQNASYVVNVSGGPAVAANGTQVGIFSYSAGATGGKNVSGVTLGPTSGSIQNGTLRLDLKASNVTQLLTIYVLVTSSYQGKNVSQNQTYAVNVIVPYRLSATIVAGSQGTVSPFALTVTLDGNAVGSISVGTLTAGAHSPISFTYVNPNLAAGWHTFAISLAQEHGLVSFANGEQSVTMTFYVAGPAPNNSIWVVTGIVAFVGVVFIYATRVGASRRGRAKK
jgi:hypothetical protein